MAFSKKIVPVINFIMNVEHPGILLLECGVQHYAWGDTEFIPSLLGIGNDDNRPFAELWMGAHPDLPSEVQLGGDSVPLNELIESAPEQVLGSAVAMEFGGRLPFLLKVLSAAKPLSIQVHPSAARASEGFARENAAGIPLSATDRNYKDENHKPELLAALTDFYGLRGFRPMEEIAGALRDVPELSSLAKDFVPSAEALKNIYERFMTLPQEEIDYVIGPLVRRLEEADQKTSFTREDQEYWLLRADREFSRSGHRDRGLFSFYLLNLIHLRPGEAMYLPSGVLHAYLEGSGMEIMANSNNVLRGGLTPKHVDVSELLSNVVFDCHRAEILRGVPVPDKNEHVYTTSAREFALMRIELEAGECYSMGSEHNVEIIVLMHSTQNPKVEFALDAQSFELSTGRACLVPHGLPYTIRTARRATLFKATVPPVSHPR